MIRGPFFALAGPSWQAYSESRPGGYRASCNYTDEFNILFSQHLAMTVSVDCERSLTRREPYVEDCRDRGSPRCPVPRSRPRTDPT